MDLVLGAKLANFAVAVAIVIGFFHGWLKLKIRHPIATFLFDIPLIIALLITFARLKSVGDWFPPGRASRALKVFYIVVAIWFLLALVLPWGAPWLAAVAALRGWVFATLMFGLGYHIIVSRRQLHAYFILIILLSAITGLYASRQTLEEVEALRAMDPYFEIMTRGQNFLDDEGRLVLRRFSTFISSGAFGGAMAVSLLFLAALLTDRSVAKKEKFILLILAFAIGWGLALSGARSALVAFGLGLILIILFRRVPQYLLLLGGAFGVAMVLAARSTDGGLLDRFSQLDFETVWGRFYIVWAPGTRFLLESNFLGGGLGKAGVGFPMSLAHYFGHYQMWGVDGDLGKTMAELGIVGVVVIAWVLFAGMADGWSILRRRRQDPVGTLALGAVCAFAIATVTFPIGSPFIGIPLGVLTWFFLGAAIKVDELESEHALVRRPVRLAQFRAAHAAARDDTKHAGTPGNAAVTSEAVTKAAAAEHKRSFLFYAPPHGAYDDSPPPAPSPPRAGSRESTGGDEAGSKKRFLFR